MNSKRIVIPEFPIQNGSFVPSSTFRTEWVKRVYEYNDFPKTSIKNRIKGWFYQKCFNLLLREKVFKPYSRRIEEIGVRKLEIDLDEVDRVIYESLHAVRFAYRKRVRMIVIGQEQLESLKSVPICPFSVSLTGYQSNTTIGGDKLRYDGIELCVLPYFSGVLVIPENE